jgi:tripartite-type tricarboxylate transporter receptor subunit TctC
MTNDACRNMGTTAARTSERAESKHGGNHVKRLIQIALAACVSIAAIPDAQAQANYPTKPVRLIVPFPPGGGTDILARLVANKLTETVGWQIVIDNRGGAGGNLGLQAAAQAPPDGYTMVLGQTSNMAINPALYSKLPYDPIRDFVPVSLVSASPIVLVVSAKSPYRSLGDLVAAAKAKPGQLTFASPGSGTVSHLTGELFQRTAGIKYVHVPYKGAAQALPDLLGGRIDIFASSLETGMSHMKAGTIRALAVTSTQRVTVAADVPTVAESGYKGFEATTWYGILVAKKTPEAIVNRLTAEITKLLQLPDMKERMAATGGIPVKTGPKEFGTLLNAEIPRWGRIVKESGAKVD